jgi:hypothetical protein
MDGAVLGSFRDPAGFMFRRNGLLFRQVDRSYQRHYDHLIGSGLYAALVADGLLISHAEVPELAPVPDRAYRVLQPEPVAFISYPTNGARRSCVMRRSPRSRSRSARSRTACRCAMRAHSTSSFIVAVPC